MNGSPIVKLVKKKSVEKYNKNCWKFLMRVNDRSNIQVIDIRLRTDYHYMTEILGYKVEMAACQLVTLKS